MTETPSTENLIDLTADIVAAYVTNNTVSSAELSVLIEQVHGSLIKLNNGDVVVADAAPQEPAVAIKRSVTPDYIICLEDGKKFKSLKRHLRTSFGMTPDEYRRKWSLPSDYPMVAPNYAASRSALAKSMGLGQQRRRTVKGASVVKAPVAKAAVAAVAPAVRRRKAG